MKTLLKTGVALALGLLLCGSRAQAQVQVAVGSPYWGPAVGPGVQYYYIPEIDGYYDLYAQSYLFYDPGLGAWVSSPVLPRAYTSYDPRFFHPVVIEYVGRQPWGYLHDHRAYCGRWGVAPGRYYGASWPGRGYNAVPYGGYNAGYYGNRSYPSGGYARNDYRNPRDNQNYRGSGPSGYDTHAGPNGRGNGRTGQNGYYSPSNPQGPAPHQGPGGRGRGRVQ